MKSLILFIFLIPLFLLSQQIHDVKVSPSYGGPTVQQARDEFWSYHTFSISPWNVWHDNTYLLSTYGLSCANPILMWDEYGDDNYDSNTQPLTRFTADAVIGYSRAWRSEIDSTKKQTYQQYALLGGEYLLCIQNINQNGGVCAGPTNKAGYFSTDPDPFSTASTIIAYLELYYSFSDIRFYNAAISAANWQMNHPTYPYGNIQAGCDCPPLTDNKYDPCEYYSNANHMGLQLWSLASVYNISGNQRYLDRCIQIAEELIAWQDYIDINNQWPSGSIPDGGWYYYDYSANPVPIGDPNPPINGSFDQNRLMGYHTFVMRGLLNLLDAIGQQSLPGVTTIRNNNTAYSFRTNLINSIKKAVNFMVDNQEDCNTSCNAGQYRGGLKHYKNNMRWSTNTFITYTATSCFGLDVLLDAYEFLKKYDKDISETDLTKVQNLSSSVAEGLFGHYLGSFWNSTWCGMSMVNWSRYINFKQSDPPVPIYKLKNVSFEEPKIIWELWSWDTSGIGLTNLVSHYGQKSVHITDNSITASKWASQIVRAHGSKEYTLSAYAKVLTGHQDLYLEFVDNQFNRIENYIYLVYPNSTFNEVKIKKTSPVNTSYIRIWLYSFWAGTSEGYWDDVKLVESLSGIITHDTTWYDGVNINGNIAINSGVTLTILPGTIITFAPSTSLSVNGELIANGTSTNKITFTFEAGTSNGSRGKILLRGKNCQFSWCLFDGGNPNVDIQSSDNTFSNCTFRNGGYGIYADGGSNTFSLNNCLIENNAGDGIYLNNVSNPNINQSTIRNNGGSGLNLLNSHISHFTNNVVKDNGAYGIYLNWGSSFVMGNGNGWYPLKTPETLLPDGAGNNWIANNGSCEIYNEYGGNFYGGIFNAPSNLIAGYNKVSPNYLYICNVVYTRANETGVQEFYSEVKMNKIRWGELASADPDKLSGAMDYSFPLGFDPLVSPGVATGSVPVLKVSSPENNARPETILTSTMVEALVNNESESSQKQFIVDLKTAILERKGEFSETDESYRCARLIGAHKILCVFDPNDETKEMGAINSELSGYRERILSNQIKHPIERLCAEGALVNYVQEVFRSGDLSQAQNLIQEYTPYLQNKDNKRVMLFAEVSVNERLGNYAKAWEAFQAVKAIGPDEDRRRAYVAPSYSSLESMLRQKAKEAGITLTEDQTDKITLPLPKAIALQQNYPNPFNPITTIKYELPVASYVTLKVYDIMGRAVAELVDGVREAGYQSATFNASNLASGIYFSRLTVREQNSNNNTQTKKMVLMK